MDTKEQKKIIAELTELEKTIQMRKGWTKEEVEIVMMFFGKVPTALIGKKLGRSAASVNSTYHRYNP